MEILTDNEKIKTVHATTLEGMYTPPAEGRWNPVPHWILNGKVTRAMANKGLTVVDTRYMITNGMLYQDNNVRTLRGDLPGKNKITVPDARMIALYTLGNGYGRDDFSHQIAVRNSVDQKWAITMSAAQTVFICSNGIMTGTRVLGRKNTTMVFHELDDLIDEALTKITLELEMNDIRFDKYRSVEIDTPAFNDLAMKAAKVGAITYNHLGKLADEWEEPTHPEFAEHRDIWRAFNCFTQVDKHRPLMTKQERTMKLIPLIDEMVGIKQVAA